MQKQKEWHVCELQLFPTFETIFIVRTVEMGGRGVSYPGPRSVGGVPRSLAGEAACRGSRD